jgi:uncharacterized membrane protein
MVQLSYINYLVLLFVITGILILVIDAKAYKQKQQSKEEKLSRVLGWSNIVLSVVVFIGNWALQKWVF